MRSLLWVIVTLLVAGGPAFAQMDTGGAVRAEFNAAAAVPLGDFGDRIDGAAAGLSAFVGGPVPHSPFVLGSEVGFLNYGSRSELRVHETVFDDGIGDAFAVPIEAVNTRVSNNILLGHLVVRLQPFQGAFQPYVDAVGGFQFFVSRLEVDSDVIVFRRGLSEQADMTDFAFSYGFGGGFELQLYEHASGWSDHTAQVSLHAGLRYLFGSDVRYASDTSIRRVDGRLYVDESETRTHMLVPQFGIRVSR